MFVKLYTDLARPHLKYGADVWNPRLKKLISSVAEDGKASTIKIFSKIFGKTEALEFSNHGTYEKEMLNDPDAQDLAKRVNSNA